jgi:putative aldouronate transport system permease protein
MSVIRFTKRERIFGWVNATLLIVLGISTLFPFMYVVSVSITPTEVIAKYGNFQVFPRAVTLEGYRFILSTPLIPRAFMNSVIITTMGTSINIVLTSLVAFPLSRRNLPGRKYWLLFVLIPMLFSGGLVPLFILVRSLKLMNTYWALVLPTAIASYYLFIMKSFFESLPNEIIESGVMDGANFFTIFLKLVLPLSKPVMATLGLFYAVGHWNGFFNALMFITDDKLQPLQVVLRNVLMDMLHQDLPEVLERFELLPGNTLKMAAVVVSVVPLLLIYPWIQKYFAKGVLLGAIKG